MPDLSLHARVILQLLGKQKNVLVIGAPATGKSRLMAEIKAAFTGTTPPVYDSKGKAPFPSATVQKVEPWMPSPTKSSRKVYEITFHQGTKHRQFVSGITPRLSDTTAGFEISDGILVLANRHAVQDRATSLLCVDEINRGPAVAIFGDVLTAIESDKRLDDNNQPLNASAPFYAYAPGGKFEAQYLSPHFYLIASMNEADTSVEPLDVAFLRRFSVYRLNPEPHTAATFLGIRSDAPLPETPTLAQHVYGALLKAWSEVNRRLALGRSPAFQLGHGVLMHQTPPGALLESLEFARESWRRIEAHVDEVFFGNDSARAIVYNAGEKTLFRLNEGYFGDQPVTRLYKIEGDLYKMLFEVGANA